MGEGLSIVEERPLWGLEEVERWGGERDHGVTAATRSTEQDRCPIPMKQSPDRQPGFFIPCCVCSSFPSPVPCYLIPLFSSRQSTPVATTSHELAGQTHQPTRTSSTPTAHVHLQRHLARLLHRRLLVG